ncbi:MAG: hypothetical protein WCR42_13905 [bacterium]
MKNVFLCVVFAIIFSIKLNCDITTNLNYAHNNIEDRILGSINYGKSTSVDSYGVYDGFRIVNLTSGISINNKTISYAYDFSVFSYLALYRIALNPKIKDQNAPGFVYDFDDHYLNDGDTYLTFSYKGPELSNIGIYSRDYNWSSVGIDFLYKNFKWKEFYTRFSYIVTASTIQNNMDYFSDIDVSNKAKFCLDMKINNSTNLLFVESCPSEFKLESYFRMIFSNTLQKEMSVNLKYEYGKLFPLGINSTLGFTRFGSKNNWNNLVMLNIGISYILKP